MHIFLQLHLSLDSSAVPGIWEHRGQSLCLAEVRLSGYSPTS